MYAINNNAQKKKLKATIRTENLEGESTKVPSFLVGKAFFKKVFPPKNQYKWSIPQIIKKIMEMEANIVTIILSCPHQL